MTSQNLAELHIGLAEIPDIPSLEALIERSARALGKVSYRAAEIEALIAAVFGVDSELVADRTYFIARRGDALAGCGGWSRRRTLFGGDRFAARDDSLLDPRHDAARIRAFFVDPDHARNGVATAILARCEEAAVAAGFGITELMATLPGRPFYGARGYVENEPLVVEANGEQLRFVRMSKRHVASLQ